MKFDQLIEYNMRNIPHKKISEILLSYGGIKVSLSNK